MTSRESGRRACAVRARRALGPPRRVVVGNGPAVGRRRPPGSHRGIWPVREARGAGSGHPRAAGGSAAVGKQPRSAPVPPHPHPGGPCLHREAGPGWTRNVSLLCRARHEHQEVRRTRCEEGCLNQLGRPWLGCGCQAVNCRRACFESVCDLRDSP